MLYQRVHGLSVNELLVCQVIADTTGAYRVLETSHPPTYYIPPNDVDMQQLSSSRGNSYCEWKGSASYYDAPGIPKIAWYYAKPTSAFKPIANYICFYPSKEDKATVGGETVKAQPGTSLSGYMLGSSRLCITGLRNLLYSPGIGT